MVRERMRLVRVGAMSVELSNYLKDEMARRGWSLTKLANKAGLPKQTVSNVINKPEQTPDLPTFVGLADALEISLARLLERAGYTVERLDDPEESSRRIARQIEDFPWLQPIFQWLLDLDPEDRAGVAAYLGSIRHHRGRNNQDVS